MEVVSLEQLIYNLLSYINNSLEKDINHSIATSLLEHIDQIHDYSLEMVAEVCNVAPSTINRFCKRIGFKNFSHLRKSVSFNVDPSTGLETDVVLNTKAFETQLNENLAVIDSIVDEQMNHIIDCIHHANKIVILGFEKHQVQALELQKKLFLLGKYCECHTNLFKQINTLSDLTEEDLIITISIEGNILAEDFAVIQKIQASLGKKLLITFSKETAHSKFFNDVLRCGNMNNKAVSNYTLLRLFDVLEDQYRQKVDKPKLV